MAKLRCLATKHTSQLRDHPMVMVAQPSVRANTIAESITYARTNPRKIGIASFGSGSASHLAGEVFKMMGGVDLVHVPYRGSVPIVADLVGGQVQAGFDVMTTAIPHIRSGRLRAPRRHEHLALCGEGRMYRASRKRLQATRQDLGGGLVS